MPDITRIPFSELFERVKTELIRDDASGSTAEYKYMGRVNDTYMFDLPSQIDWKHYQKTGTIAGKADYNTGYIATASTSVVTGSGTTWTSLNSNGFVLKVNGYNELYRVTYSGATTLSLDRNWIETSISSNTTYTLYQDRYALASDFDRMIIECDKCVYYYDSGYKVYLQYKDATALDEIKSTTPGTPMYYTVKYINNSPYIYIDVPLDTAMTIEYVYMPKLARMKEYATGTVTDLANAGTAVTGSSTDFDGFVSDTTNYKYYFRLDRDGTASASRWYLISTAASDTSLTLSDAYEGTTVSGGSLAYTISVCSVLPAGLDTALMYGAAMASSADQDNTPQMQAWLALYNAAVTAYRRIEDKRGYGKGRVGTIYEQSGARK